LNSTFDKLISTLFYSGRLLDEELARSLKIAFANKGRYSFWGKGYDICRKEGKKAAIKWLREIAPVLKLRNKLEGDR
jgi:hypothetical protein